MYVMYIQASLSSSTTAPVDVTPALNPNNDKSDKTKKKKFLCCF